MIAGRQVERVQQRAGVCKPVGPHIPAYHHPTRPTMQARPTTA
jgi:hypothetical protein